YLAKNVIKSSKNNFKVQFQKTDLILRQEHQRLMHCGVQQLLSLIREKCWIICSRNKCKSIKWQRIQVSVQHVWNWWKNEYLSEQNRVKLKRNSQGNFKVGTLVLVKHDSGPILDWKLGRIVKLYPGKDNVCRVVDKNTSEYHKTFR
ncbi:hypothetical protein HUJ05_010205, partial [Dendroctonus ponderosae]